MWDAYKESSIKESTREKRGEGVRRKVGETTKLPPNFQIIFLRDGKNKEELFKLLTEKVSAQDYETGKEVYITAGKLILGTYLNNRIKEPYENKVIYESFPRNNIIYNYIFCCFAICTIIFALYFRKPSSVQGW